MNKRSVGSKYEDMAVSFLRANGVKIIGRNFRSRFGEIDIAGHDGSCYIFCEVKYRKTGAAGDPALAVDRRKQYRISRVADYFRVYRKLKDSDSVRFDVIAILDDEITWYKNAFEYIPN
ncbi:MAG TPA: YraN family protein [Lachnospiraceae bacterium]|nr:YraN family protein [Lachnospiraceae bacterium]